MRLTGVLAVGMVLCLCLFVSPAKTAVQIDSCYLGASVSASGNTVYDRNDVYAWNQPYCSSVTGAMGNVSSGSLIAKQEGDLQSFLVYDVTLSREGSPDNNNAVLHGYFNFHVDVESTFKVAGQFLTTGSSLANARWLMQVWDGAAWSFVFDEHEYNYTQSDGQFTLNGTMDGERGTLQGDPNDGLLLPGMRYMFDFTYTLQDYDATSDTNAAWADSAWFALDIAPTSSIPEPTAFAIWGTLGGLGLIAARRRGRVA